MTRIKIRISTCGLVCFAVPHQGGHGAGLRAIAKNIVLSPTGDANNDLLGSLKSNSLFQENQTAFFKHQLEDWGMPSWYGPSDKILSRDYAFHFARGNPKQDGISRSISEQPIDHLGFAASYGMKFSIMKSLSADHHSRNASYFLCCAISSLYHHSNGSPITSRVLDLACTFLNYGANSNLPAFGSTVWGYFLLRIFLAKLSSRPRARYNVCGVFNGKSLTRAFKCFIENGADKNGILTSMSWLCAIKIDETCLQRFSNTSRNLEYKQGSDYYPKFGIKISVPTRIRYCLSDSPNSADMYSVCVLDGAFSHSRYTESSGMEFGTWALSEQQSDRFIRAFERWIIPTETPPPCTETEFRRQLR